DVPDMGGLDGWCRFFFLRAEDGIRVLIVTGVQTCALPICDAHRAHHAAVERRALVDAVEVVEHRRVDEVVVLAFGGQIERGTHRSEERRVGKERRARWRPSE